MNSPIVHTFSQSGSVGQLIMLSLFGLSILTWGVIAKKIKDARDQKKYTAAFLSIFRRNTKDLLSIRSNLKTPCHMAEVFKSGAGHLSQILKGQDHYASGEEGLNERGVQVAQVARTRAHLEERDVELLDGTLQRAVTEQLMKLDQYNVLLAVTAGAAPLLGLLGTVWGIMESFRSMGIHGNASISVVAPGISAALVTTVAGLIVAIPALIAYNLSVNYAKATATRLDNFGAEFLSIVKQRYVGR